MIEMIKNIRYIVTKGSDDTTFVKDDVIVMHGDGVIMSVQAGGWIEAIDVDDATVGMEIEEDKEWIKAERIRLQKELDNLPT